MPVSESASTLQPTGTATVAHAQLVTQVLSELVDPLNRFYRYPLCEAMFPLLRALPITPNQITVIHTLIGIAGGGCIAYGTRTALICGFVCAELRMVLDCLDGVVARRKKLFHPHGRTIDELGDAVGVIGLMLGVYYNSSRGITSGTPYPHAGLLACGVLAISGVMAWGYDFFKRKFTSALRDNEDGIVRELTKKTLAYRAAQRGFVASFGFAFDWLQVLVLSPRTRRAVMAEVDRAERAGLTTESSAGSDGNAPGDALGDVSYIRAQVSSPRLRRTLRLIAWVSGDNAVLLLNLGLLTGALVLTQQVIIGYGIALLVVGALACATFLRGARGPALLSVSRSTSVSAHPSHPISDSALNNTKESP
jgi:phosphatidylglycerophosphate synthase